MSAPTFTQSDLMQLLTEKTGLPAASHTSDPDAHFADVGLDSLAFLSMQTELQDRFGIAMPDDNPDAYSFGQIVEAVSAAQAAQPA